MTASVVPVPAFFFFSSASTACLGEGDERPRSGVTRFLVVSIWPGRLAATATAMSPRMLLRFSSACSRVSFAARRVPRPTRT
jgi:hypothetical protein